MGALVRWFRNRGGRRNGPRCRTCGLCCELYGGNLRASRADMERWRGEGRRDLLDRVNALGWIWIDSGSGRVSKQCPFLVRSDPRRVTCGIHDTKPQMCREYPTLAHAKRCVGGVVFR